MLGRDFGHQFETLFSLHPYLFFILHLHVRSLAFSSVS